MYPLARRSTCEIRVGEKPKTIDHYIVYPLARKAPVRYGEKPKTIENYDHEVVIYLSYFKINDRLTKKNVMKIIDRNTVRELLLFVMARWGAMSREQLLYLTL